MIRHFVNLRCSHSALPWLVTWLCVTGMVLADDWPQFRGAQHDGISRETGFRTDWKAAPPQERWRAELGIGFSGISVAKQRVVSSGHLDGEDVVQCFDEASGAALWRFGHASDLGAMFYIGGPGSTPTIEPASDRVYVVGKWGELFCLDLRDGSVIWKRHVAREEDLVVPDWGYNGSALIWDDLLVVNLGRAGMAVKKDSGETVWKSEGSECGYSTPMPYRQGDGVKVAVSSGEAYSGVDLATGTIEWSIPWFTRYGVNAADPIVWKGQVFISSGYQKGAGLYTIGKAEPDLVWKQRHFRAQQNGPVRLGGYLYGFDGDSSSRAKLKCVAWETGEIQWEDESLGYGALIAADGHLIMIGTDGRLGIAAASPKGLDAVVTKSVLAPDCWTTPVLANGRILCRNSKGNLVSLDVQLEPSR